jgi:hypothetical protein
MFIIGCNAHLTQAFSVKHLTRDFSRRKGRHRRIWRLNAPGRNGHYRALGSRRSQGLRWGQRADNTSQAAIDRSLPDSIERVVRLSRAAILEATKDFPNFSRQCCSTIRAQSFARSPTWKFFYKIVSWRNSADVIRSAWLGVLPCLSEFLTKSARHGVRIRHAAAAASVSCIWFRVHPRR